MIGIPKGAKRVFKGVIFDVYQWEQELYDGSKATFEKLKRQNSTDVIAVTENKKILLAFDEQPARPGVYTTLGGRVDDGEEPLEAAKRELLEESGYTSGDWELLSSDVPSHKIDWTVYTYIARNCKKVSEPKLESGERIKIQEVDFDEFIDVATTEGFQHKELAMMFLRMKVEGTLEALKKRLMK